MRKEKLSRRDIVISATVAGALVASISASFMGIYYSDRISTELSDEVQTTLGTVVGKKYASGGYLNPSDSINPFSDFDLTKRITKFSDNYVVVIRYKHGRESLDDREIYDKVKEGDEVTVQFQERFSVRKNYEGKELERIANGYKIVKVLPN